MSPTTTSVKASIIEAKSAKRLWAVQPDHAPATAKNFESRVVELRLLYESFGPVTFDCVLSHHHLQHRKATAILLTLYEFSLGVFNPMQKPHFLSFFIAIVLDN